MGSKILSLIGQKLLSSLCVDNTLSRAHQCGIYIFDCGSVGLLRSVLIQSRTLTKSGLILVVVRLCVCGRQHSTLMDLLAVDDESRSDYSCPLSRHVCLSAELTAVAARQTKNRKCHYDTYTMNTFAFSLNDRENKRLSYRREPARRSVGLSVDKLTHCYTNNANRSRVSLRSTFSNCHVFVPLPA